MADGGASSFIFLATALLISGAVSAVLISQYGDITSAMEQERRENEADSKTSFDYAGDLSNVAYDTNPTESITFYLQNSGEWRCRNGCFHRMLLMHSGDESPVLHQLRFVKQLKHLRIAPYLK